MTISLRAAGTVTTSGAAVTALSPAVPATATTGDLSILSVNMKPYSATINTPSGWTKISEYTNGTVASSTDLGSTKVAVFVKESASVGAIGNLTWGTAPDSASAVINTYAKTGTAWDYSAFQVGIDSTNAANYSATGIGGMGVQTGDWIVCSTSTNNDLGISGAIAMSFSGATLSASNNRTVSNTSIGNDSGLYVVDASVTAVTTSAGPPVFSYTATQLGSGTTLFLRLREISAPVGPVLSQSQMVKLDTNTNTNLVTAPFTWNAGDVFVVKNINASVGAPAIGTPTATGLTFAVKASFATASKCEISIYTAVAASSGTSAITTVWSGSTGFHSSQIERWTNAALEATPASVSTSGSSVGPSATITTNGTNSAVTWASGDWSARAQGTIALRSSAYLEGTTGGDTTTYTAYYAEQDAATAGSQTIGMTTPATSQNWSIAAIEILAAATATTVQKTSATTWGVLAPVTKTSATTWNVGADPLYRWKIARAAVATTPAKLLAIGDSITEGQGASLQSNRWLNKLRDSLRIYYPSGAVGGENYIPSFYMVGAPDSPWNSYTSFTGSPSQSSTNGSLGYRTVFFSATGSLTYSLVGTSADIWWIGGGGTFSYQIDGGSTINVNTAGTYHTDYRTNVSLGAAGSHTVVISWVSGTIGFSGFTVFNGDSTSGIQIFDAARSGSKTADHLIEGGELIKAIQTVSPDLVTIELGGNDALQSVSAATFGSNLQTIVSGILGSVSPAPSIVIIALYTPAASAAPGVVWSDYVAAMASVASADPNHITLIDLSALMPTATTAGTGFYATDGLHPNNSGHIEIARLVNNTIGVALTTVQKTSSTTWEVRVNVAKTSATNWGVKSAGSKTSATTWGIKAVVQKTSATTWAVLSGQTKTSSTTWAVRSNVVKTSSTTWGVRSSVIKTSATSWNVYGVVTPVGEWGFNDNTGTDSSGHGQNLTVIGSPSVAGGHTGNAATTGVTNRFEGAVGPGSLSTYTVMAWVKFAGWTNPFRAVLSNGSNFFLEFSNNGADINLECYSGNGTFPKGPTGYTNTSIIGQWMHIATTRNADGTTKVFVNGVEVGSGLGNAIDFSSTAFEVGSYGDGTQYLLDGLIDDLRVFDASMDATAVSAWKDIPVGSSTTTVQKTSATTWNIAQTLQKTNINTWAVAQSIQKTSATNWAVRSGITKTSISNWAVQQSISKTSATNWSVRAPVVKTSATNWAVSASVLKTSVTTWAVRSSLVKTSATNWGVLSGVSKTSLTNWAVASKITKTSITNWAVRASVIKISATAWVVIVTDAVVTRTEAHLTPFAIWCANNGVLGAIGEFGIMNETSGAELPKWNNLGYAYLDMLRRTGLTGIEWAASRVFGDTDPQVVVAASDANYPNSADQEMQNSGPIKNAVITLPLTRGINLAGGEFAAANGTSGGATLPSNGTLYSNVNPGTHNADYGYPVAADWAKLSAMGIKLVRLPFSWERIQNSLNGTLNATEVTRIQGVLSDAASNGISVILDCHNYAQYYLGTSPTARTILYLGGTGATLQHTHLTDLWTKINTAFSGSSNIVAYDLMNEPAVQDNAGTYVNDTQAVDNWKTISANVVSALRTAGVTKTLIVSGWWGSPPQTWVTKHGSTPWITDSLNNTIYSAHQYFDGASDEPHSGTYYRSDGYTYAKELALAEASSVIKTSDTSWNVIGRVQKTSSTIWSVKASVAKTSATIWAVRTGITKTSVTTWAVRNALTKTSLTNWSVLNKVNKTNVTNWSVLTIGSKSISTTWAAVGRLQKTSATIWSVLSNITGGKWLPAPSNLLTVDSNQQLPLMNGWFSYTTTTGSKRSGNGNYTLTLESNQKIISHQVNSAGVYPNGYVAVPGEVLDFSVSALGIENLNTSADCTVGIMWIDSANHLISTSSSAVRAPFGVKVRVAVNATTPNNAVKYLVFIKSDEPCVISNTTLSNNGNTGPEFPEFDGSKWVAHSPNLMPVYYDTGGPGRMFGWRKSTDLTIVSPVNGLLSIPTNTIYVLDFRENTSTTGHAGIPISSSTSYTFAISEMTAAIVDLSLKFYDITGTVLIGTITLDKTVARRNISFISPANTASMVIEISTTGVASSLFDPTLIAFAGELSLPSNLTLPSSGLLLHSNLIVEPYSPDYVGVITRDLEISYRNNTLAGRTTDIKYDSRTLSNASVTTIWSNLVTVPFKDFDIRYPNSQLTQSALTVNSNNRGFANSNITIQSAVHRLVGTYPVFTWEDWQNTNEKNIILEHANLAAISKNITLQYADCKLVSDSLIIVWGVNKKNNGPVIHPQPYLDGVSDIIHISSHVSNPIRTESKVYTLAHTKPLR